MEIVSYIYVVFIVIGTAAIVFISWMMFKGGSTGTAKKPVKRCSTLPYKATVYNSDMPDLIPGRTEPEENDVVSLKSENNVLRWCIKQITEEINETKRELERCIKWCAEMSDKIDEQKHIINDQETRLNWLKEDNERLRQNTGGINLRRSDNDD